MTGRTMIEWVRRRTGMLRVAAVAGLVVAGWSSVGLGQGTVREGTRLALASRAELEESATAAEQIANSPSAGESLRRQKAAEAQVIRARLASGDVFAGDRIAIRVVGDQLIADTLTVGSGGVISIPNMGPISVRGVLRSELEPRLKTEIGRFLRNVTVTATILTRLAVVGQVGRPGFHQLPSDFMLSQALMAAGGPGGMADLHNITIRRGEAVLWDPKAVTVALQEGVTLQEMGLRGGDEITVGMTSQGFGFYNVVQAVTVTSQILSTILFLTRKR